jgi:CO/xanthine dehydrogenase FAD-binding subunit
MPNTPVGSLDVKSNKSIKVKGQLDFPQKTKSPSGATTGGIPPPKNGPIFSQKVRERAKYDSTLASSEFRRGAGGQAERTRELEIAYASTRIRPFSLASGQRATRENELPQPEFIQAKEKTEQRDKRNKKHHLHLSV